MYELPARTNVSPVAPIAPSLIPPPGNAADIAGFFSLLQRRFKFFITLFAVFFLIAILVSLLIPKSYVTEAKLIAGNPNRSPDSVGTDTNYTTLPVLNALVVANGVQTTETYAELFQETPIANRVIASEHLDMSATSLLTHVKVKPVTNTSILSLAVSWQNAAKSASIANAFAQAFVERQRTLIADQAQQALTFLGTQLPAAQRAVQRTAGAVASFESKYQIADIDAQTQTMVTTIAALDAKISQTQVDQRQANAQMASLRSQLAHIAPMVNGNTSVVQNPVVGQLQNQLAQVTVQLESARKQYTDQYPNVIALKQQQSEIKRQLAAQPATIVANANSVSNPVYQQLQQQADQYRAQAQADTAQLALLNQQRAQMQPALTALPGQTARLAELKRQAKVATDVNDALQQKANDFAVMRSTAISDVTITQPASAASAIKKPNTILSLLAGMIIALALAVMGAVAMEYFDRTLKDEDDIQRRFGLPLLARIPILDSSDETPALPWLKAMSVEAYLQLVTSLRYASDQPLRTLAITSPLQGDGKSTIALNTAFAMAELEPRVLLIDTDMRRPSLHTRTNQEMSPGLSDVLVGNCQLQEAIRETKHNGLDILVSGASVPNPIKLLQSRRFKELLATARERYSMVILDCCALNAIFDAVVTSMNADGTVLVFRAGKTEVSAATKALQRLESVGAHNVIGYVLNNAKPERNAYSAYYLHGTPVINLPLAKDLL